MAIHDKCVECVHSSDTGRLLVGDFTRVCTLLLHFYSAIWNGPDSAPSWSHQVRSSPSPRHSETTCFQRLGSRLKHHRCYGSSSAKPVKSTDMSSHLMFSLPTYVPYEIRTKIRLILVTERLPSVSLRVKRMSSCHAHTPPVLVWCFSMPSRVLRRLIDV